MRPLTIRNAVRVYDTHLLEGHQTEVPTISGMSPWLYVMDGTVEIGGERLGKGDAASDLDQPLPALRSMSEATLVLFLVDRTAPASMADTISGR